MGDAIKFSKDDLVIAMSMGKFLRANDNEELQMTGNVVVGLVLYVQDLQRELANLSHPVAEKEG
jgi:hypothetical protein